MPFSRPRVRSGRRGGPRRETEWAALVATGAGTIATASTKLILNTFSASALSVLVPTTVIRMRGLLSHKSDQAAQTEEYAGAVGAVIVRDDARNIGITALPGPLSASGDDVWLWHQFYTGEFRFADASGIVPIAENIIVIDSKAQRKIVDGDAIVIIAESASFGLGVSLKFFARLLFKLH